MSAETDLGQRAIDVISGVLRTATTHDTANDAVQRLLGDLRKLVSSRPGKREQPLVLLIEGSEVFVDQELLSLELPAWRRARKLGAALATQGANELCILPSASSDDLAAFFRRFGQAVQRGRPDESLKDLSLNRIAVAHREVEMGSLQQQEKIEVMKQFGGLLVVCEEYASRIAHEGTAPTVAARRALQRTADAMLAAPDIWAGLLLMPQTTTNSGQHAARAAALAAFFGSQLGSTRATTSRAALMAMRAATHAAVGATRPALAAKSPSNAVLDQEVRAQALDAALGLRAWPAKTPAPLESVVAALAIETDRAAQGRGNDDALPPASAFAAALERVSQRVPVPRQLSKRITELLGPTPPGTLVKLPGGDVGVWGPAGQALRASGAAKLPPMSGVQRFSPAPGPWTSWLVSAVEASEAD